MTLVRSNHIASPPSILVVDDDALITMLLEDMLLEIGCDVVGPARSVEAALACIEANGQPLDGAFIDVNLRGEVVYPVAEALMRGGVPFVFVSGDVGHGIDPRYAAVPALAKPFTFAMIDRAVARFVDRGRAWIGPHMRPALDLRHAWAAIASG